MPYRKHMNEFLEIVARMVRTLTACAFLVWVGYMMYDSPRLAGGISVLCVTGWAWWKLPKKSDRGVA